MNPNTTDICGALVKKLYCQCQGQELNILHNIHCDSMENLPSQNRFQARKGKVAFNQWLQIEDSESIKMLINRILMLTHCGSVPLYRNLNWLPDMTLYPALYGGKNTSTHTCRPKHKRLHEKMNLKKLGVTAMTDILIDDGKTPRGFILTKNIVLDASRSTIKIHCLPPLFCQNVALIFSAVSSLKACWK